MREMLNKYVFFITCLFVSFEMDAAPPSPTPPPPPGFPIGENLGMLFVFALFFGFYKIYISVFKKKRSV